MELEADEYGARYANAAGMDPKGLMTFFGKLKAKYGDQPAVLVWLSTHPANQERIDKIAAFVAAGNLTSTDLGADRLAPIKQALGGRR